MISGVQIAAGRALIDMHQKAFAKHIGCSAPTLCMYENGLHISESRMAKIISVFNDRGVSFVNTNEGQGVFLCRNL